MRLNRKGEMYSHIRSVEVLREHSQTHGATTLGAAAVAGATSLTVAAITNFAVGETTMVGDGESREVVRIHASTAPAGNTIALDPATPLRHAHPAGERVFECEAIDLGPIDQGSPQIDYSGSGEEVYSDTDIIMHGYLPGHLAIAIMFALLSFNVENLAFALGLTESTKVRGAGTSADPRELTIDGDGIRAQDDVAIRFNGTKKDGSLMRITAMACEFDVSAVNFSLSRGQKVTLPVRARPTAGVLYETWK